LISGRNKLSFFPAFLLIAFLFLSLCKLGAQSGEPDSVITAKLNEIHTIYSGNRKSAQNWWCGWLAGYSAATIGQGIVYFSTDNKSLKQDMALGSATTFLGAMMQIVTPIVPPHTSKKDFKPSVEDYNNPEYFEGLLKEIALKEKAGRSWKIHALTGAANIGSGMITWLGFKRSFTDGVVNFALNTVITEAQIWTQPTRAVKDYRNYYKKYYSDSPLSFVKKEYGWLVSVSPARIIIKYNF